MALVAPKWILEETVNRETFSYSNPNEAQVTRMCFTLDMNNSDRSLFASNVLTVERKHRHAKYVRLDVFDLNIVSVRYCADKGLHVPYYLTRHDKLFGQGLVIQLPDCNTCTIVIKYITSENTPGLQWHARGNSWMMHSTFYYSLARSVIPCQDAPGIKCTYTAEVIVPAQYEVLMSAVPVSKRRVNDNFTAYRFEQNLPVCAYQIGFAIGRFEHRDISTSTRVYHETETTLDDNLLQLLQKIPQALKKLETIQGPFVWGIADVLIMKEQTTRSYPCLMWLYEHGTINHILNILARSWISTVVSCRTWQDFWIHEAYSKFMERKLLAIVTDISVQDEWQHGAKVLAQVIQPGQPRDPAPNMKPKSDEIVGEYDAMDRTNMKLLPDLTNFDPNTSISDSRSILAEKGAILFYTIEEIVGVTEFENFLWYIVEKYKYGTISTEEFIDELKGHFINMKLWALDFPEWLKSPGNAPRIPEYVLPDTETIEIMGNIIALNKDDLPLTKSDFKQLSMKQMKYLLNLLLKKDLAYDTVKTLHDLLSLERFEDLELRSLWLQLCVRNRFYRGTDFAMSGVKAARRLNEAKSKGVPCIPRALVHNSKENKMKGN